MNIRADLVSVVIFVLRFDLEQISGYHIYCGKSSNHTDARKNNNSKRSPSKRDPRTALQLRWILIYINWTAFPGADRTFKRTVKIHRRDVVWTEYGIAASTNLLLDFCSTTGPMRPVQIKSPSISGRNIDCSAFHVAIVKRDTFLWAEQIQPWCISEDQPRHHSPLIRNQ